MNNIKQEWQKTQLHWDDKTTIQRQKVPKSVIFNWRKINLILQELCKEKKTLNNRYISIIDIGCGSGKIYNGLESYVNPYIGVDPSDKMLSYIQKGPNQQFIRAVGEQLPLKENIADIVLLKSVLDQCYSPTKVVSEAKRVLKNNGWLIISLSNKNSYYASIRKLYNRLRGHTSQHIFEKGNLFYFGMNEVESMLKNDGFQPIKLISVGYFVFPKTFERLIPERIFANIVNIADKIGSVVLPKKGGGFVFVGEKK